MKDKYHLRIITSHVNDVHQSPHAAWVHVAEVIISEQHLIEILRATEPIQIAADAACDRLAQA